MNDAGAQSAQFFINATDTETRGADLVAEWRPDVKRGTLETRLAANVTRTRTQGGFSAPGLLSGLADDLFTRVDEDIIESWQPENRLTLAATYRLGALALTGSVNRYGSYIASEIVGGNHVEQKFDPAYVTDIRVKWKPTDALTFTLIGDNVFDTYPERNDLTATRGGVIRGIVDNPRGVFTYSRRTAPYGFNGAYWGVQMTRRF